LIASKIDITTRNNTNY